MCTQTRVLLSESVKFTLMIKYFTRTKNICNWILSINPLEIIINVESNGR